MQRVRAFLKISSVGLCLFISAQAYSRPLTCAQTFRSPESLTSLAIQFSQASAFINQIHPDLGDRGLLTPEGGLCAITSLTYAITVMSAANSGARPRRDVASQGSLIERLVREASRVTSNDARNGIQFHHLQRLVSSLDDDLIPGRIVEASLDNYIASQHLDEFESLIDNDDVLTLAAVNWQKTESHALLFVALGTNNRGQKIVRYIDPMNPNQIKESRVIQSFEGRRSVLNLADYHGAQIESLISLRLKTP